MTSTVALNILPHLTSTVHPTPDVHRLHPTPDAHRPIQKERA